MVRAQVHEITFVAEDVLELVLPIERADRRERLADLLPDLDRDREVALVSEAKAHERVGGTVVPLEGLDDEIRSLERSKVVVGVVPTGRPLGRARVAKVADVPHTQCRAAHVDGREPALVLGESATVARPQRDVPGEYDRTQADDDAQGTKPRQAYERDHRRDDERRREHDAKRRHLSGDAAEHDGAERPEREEGDDEVGEDVPGEHARTLHASVSVGVSRAPSRGCAWSCAPCHARPHDGGGRCRCGALRGPRRGVRRAGA